MGSIFHGWKSRWVRSGLGMALLGLTIGCTNNGANTFPNKNQLPPPKPFERVGVLPVNSPAYNNLQGNGQPPTGANPFNPAANNNTTTLPTTRISAPESARPNPNSAMNPQVGIPNNPVGNPASFNGPYSNAYVPPNPIQQTGYNPPTNQNVPQQPIQQMQPLTPQPVQTPNRLPAINPVPPQNNNSVAPAWPNPNPQVNPTPPNNPANWTPPSDPAPLNNGNLNPVPPAPPVGFNLPASSSGMQPLKLPDSISAKPTNSPAIQPVGAIDPVVDNTPAPIMAPAPTKVISTFPPQQPRRENVPPVVIGSDDIPSAPVIPRR